MKIEPLISITSLTIALLLSGCAALRPPPPPQVKDTIRLCDENGCVERPKGYSTFDPTATTPEEEANNQKIAALEEIAKKDPSAAYDLALRLFRGDGVRQDSYHSVQWMRDAAERGHFEAQKALGRLYLTGLGEMGSDPGEAEKWLSITASRGDKEARTLLKEAVIARQSLQNEYRWYDRWRSRFYNYWYYSYPYYWRWRGNRWYYYYP